MKEISEYTVLGFINSHQIEKGSSSIIDMVQEMGRCGQSSGRSRPEVLLEDNFNVFFSLEDYVYLNQRL